MTTKDRTCKEWCDYLTIRCRIEGVELWLTPPELSGWVSAGVAEAGDEDEVFAALQESLNDTE